MLEEGVGWPRGGKEEGWVPPSPSKARVGEGWGAPPPSRERGKGEIPFGWYEFGTLFYGENRGRGVINAKQGLKDKYYE